MAASAAVSIDATAAMMPTPEPCGTPASPAPPPPPPALTPTPPPAAPAATSVIALVPMPSVIPPQLPLRAIPAAASTAVSPPPAPLPAGTPASPSPATPAKPTPSVFDTVCALTASDSNWRNKVLKVVQYAARLVVWLHGRLPADGVLRRILSLLLTPPARAKEIAKSLSLARRVQVWGDGTLSARRAVATLAAGGGSGGVPAILRALIDGTAGLLDDVQTATKVSVLDAALLPAAFPRAVNVSWAMQSASSLQQAVAKWATLRAAAAAAAAPLSPKAAADLASARLNVFKCSCDLLQALPLAAAWGWWPEVLEILSGLVSAVVSVVRIWQAARPLLVKA